MGLYLISLMIESEAQSGGGRMSKGPAPDRARRALERAGFEQDVNVYGLETKWYGRAKSADNVDNAVDNLISRAGFIVCDMPDLSGKPMLNPSIDTNKPCLSNKSGDVFVLFDTHGGAVIIG